MGRNGGEKASKPADTSDERKTNEAQEEIAEEPPTEPTATDEPADLLHRGQTLADQNGCLGCHSIDGTRIVGPSFKGMMERERTIIRGEQKEKILADSDYLTRSIREPSAEVVEGYPAIMPSFPDFSDDDIKALQNWLETLK
jgi:cytochrome c551/c552